VVAAVELLGEEDVLQLHGAVRDVGVEVPVVLEVVHFDLARQPRGEARGLDHRGVTGDQLVEEKLGQQERREVVDLKGLLALLRDRGGLLRGAA
jgi:hypothetical protein